MKFPSPLVAAENENSLGMEEDLFFELFGESGILTPESISSSTTDDSGLGSPFGSSCSDSSPLQFPHEDHELWDSILDDLPNDIADEDSDGSLELQQPFVNTNTVEPPQQDSFANLFWSKNPNMGGNIDNINWNWMSGLVDHQNTPQFTTTIDESLITNIIQPSSDTETQHTNKNPTLIDQTSLQAPVPTVPDVNNIDMIIETDTAHASKLVDMTSILSGVLSNTELSTVKEKPGAHISMDHNYAGNNLSSSTESKGVSLGMGRGVVLTTEEKKELERERTSLPENLPLTKDEEKILKKVRRKIRNKQSAMESRRRRKDYIYNLENRVKHCTDVNTQLTKKVDKLSKDNEKLVNELKVMKEYCKLIQKTSGGVSRGTCLAVFLLSFAFMVLPFNPQSYFDGKSEVAGASPTVPTYRSRTLLSIPSTLEDTTYQDDFVKSSFYASTFSSSGDEKAQSLVSKKSLYKNDTSTVFIQHNIAFSMLNGTTNYKNI
jgi:hypothetical protein